MDLKKRKVRKRFNAFESSIVIAFKGEKQLAVRWHYLIGQIKRGENAPFEMGSF